MNRTSNAANERRFEVSNTDLELAKMNWNQRRTTDRDEQDVSPTEPYEQHDDQPPAYEAAIDQPRSGASNRGTSIRLRESGTHSDNSGAAGNRYENTEEIHDDPSPTEVLEGRKLENDAGRWNTGSNESDLGPLPVYKQSKAQDADNSIEPGMQVFINLGNTEKNGCARS